MTETQLLPLTFNYDEQNRTVDVEYGDGSIVRYFDIDPRLAFVSSTNPRRNRDFLDYLENEFVPGITKLVKVRRLAPLKQEVIQEATEELNVPSTRAATFLNAMQNSQSNVVTIPNWPLDPTSYKDSDIDETR